MERKRRPFRPFVAHPAGYPRRVGRLQSPLPFHRLRASLFSIASLSNTADTLTTGKMETRLLCRTFSDCTTAPRNGLVSGCYPLDEHYKSLTEAARLKKIKRG